MMLMRHAGFAACMVALALGHGARAAAPADSTIPVIDGASIGYDENATDGSPQGPYRVFKNGQIIEAEVELPAAPVNQRDARRIVVSVDIEPAIITEGGKRRPADPWTRLGKVTCVLPAATDGTKPKPGAEQHPDIQELELVRFITSFGGPGTFSQDVTSLAPLLQGKVKIRAFIGTITSPAWKVTVTLRYTSSGV